MDIAREQGVVGRGGRRCSDEFDMAVAASLKKTRFIRHYMAPEDRQYVLATNQLTDRIGNRLGLRFATYQSGSDNVGVSAFLRRKIPAAIAQELGSLCSEGIYRSFCLVVRGKTRTAWFAVLHGNTLRARIHATGTAYGVFFLDGREFVVMPYRLFVKAMDSEVSDVR